MTYPRGAWNTRPHAGGDLPLMTPEQTGNNVCTILPVQIAELDTVTEIVIA